MKFRFVPSLILPLAVCVTSFVQCAEHSWPQWRGPDGQGHATGSGYPVLWSEKENVAWRCPVPGRGWSSPVVGGGMVWMTTAIETPASPEQTAQRLKQNTGDQPLNLLAQVELRAVGVDAKTGMVVRDVLLLTVKEPQWVHQTNSYASPSPVLAGDRLYCHFGALGTACVETSTGHVRWTNRDLVIMHENGPGSSPVLWNGKLIFHMDGSDQQFIAALDADTGAMAWKTARTGEMHSNPQLKKSYGTPLVMNLDGKARLLSPASNWLYCYDDAGREIWKVSYGVLGFSLTPRPVAGHGMFFLSTGFMRPEILAMRLRGDTAPEIAWRSGKGAPTISSPALVGSELYFINEGGILTCVDAHSGEEIFRERIGGEFSASPTVAENRLYLSNRDGETTVVNCGRKFEVLARNKLSGKILASLAAEEGTFYLRTDTALYRLSAAQARQ